MVGDVDVLFVRMGWNEIGESERRFLDLMNSQWTTQTTVQLRPSTVIFLGHAHDKPDKVASESTRTRSGADQAGSGASRRGNPRAWNLQHRQGCREAEREVSTHSTRGSQ